MTGNAIPDPRMEPDWRKKDAINDTGSIGGKRW